MLPDFRHWASDSRRTRTIFRVFTDYCLGDRGQRRLGFLGYGRERLSSEFEDDRLRNFSLYIHDRRYSVPTLEFIVVPDEDLAREAAQHRLERSEDYQAIEVCESEQPLFRIERPEMRISG